MKDDLFAELVESVREGGVILKGRAKPTRVTQLDESDIGALREAYGLSQEKFAALMGISVGTLRNWEQGRRKPEGSARVLLRVVARHPQAILDVVRGGSANKRMQRTASKGADRSRRGRKGGR